MWRTLSVCDDCWLEKEGDRNAIRLVDPDHDVCIVCEKQNTSGIYVRMEVTWS